MTPSPNPQAVIVGLFVTLALAILGGAILTIGDLNDTFTRKVQVSAVFDEVNGLQTGNNIWYSGVKVGTVKKLAFHGGSQVQVDMRVDVDATQYIHGDVKAKVDTDGLIGNKIVVLYGGTTGAAPLADGDVLETEKALSSEDIMATLQENNKNLVAITANLKTVSADLAAGNGSIGKLLKDDTLYNGANDTIAKLNAASDSARSVTNSLATFSAKLNQAGNLPNDLVTDKTTYAELAKTVSDLQAASEKASALMDGVAKGASDPSTPIGALVQDDKSGTQVKETLENLNKSSLLLSQDLEALQHNFLLRPYFKKQEKAAKDAAQKQ